MSLLDRISETLACDELTDKIRDCIEWQRNAVELVIENSSRLPPGTRIFTCTNTSTHDPHYWIEFLLPDNNRLVWDGTNQKIPSHFMMMDEAIHIWPDYEYGEKVQIFPEPTDQ